MTSISPQPGHPTVEIAGELLIGFVEQRFEGSLFVFGEIRPGSLHASGKRYPLRAS
jgi:hypothetical protein